MNTTQADFYVTGGTLGQDVPSYVPRQADQELYESLRRGEFCYVLTSRQMGKSSLMVRAAARLRSDGAAVAVLDLTGIGVNVTAEQWYDGLLMRVGEQLDLEDELEEFWLGHERQNPLRRWMQAVEQVVLARHAGLVVIFVDEIDVVRGLPFSADEFFAGIRECYNRRTEQPELSRLAFCLLGVATPSDLIQDPHMTPFNIGRRIQLDDFRHDEASVLADGLSSDPADARRMLQRVMYWTGGHPYLTQRLCSSVANHTDGTAPADVDRACREDFIAHPASERDDNLSFVRQRLLHSHTDQAGLLDLYLKVLRRQRVEADETKPLVASLRLTGIVRTAGSRLEARNRIYAAVFDRDWVRANMPDAELRRQRAAFRRGLLRASAVACVVILILTVSVVFAFRQWQRAETAATAERRERKNAVAAKLEAEAARDEAASARDAEREQRKKVEQARQVALAEQRKALHARDVAESATKRADEERRRVEAANQETQAALELAEAAKRTAEDNEQHAKENARRAERTAQLFKQLLPRLAESAAEGAHLHAQSLARQGKPREAIKTLQDFCDVALGPQQGLDARDLLKLDPNDLVLLALDDEPTATRLSVPPLSLIKSVLEPAIELGEKELRDESESIEKSEVARLHVTRARLIAELNEGQRPADLPLAAAVRAYDRAIELEPAGYEHYAARAAARFRLADHDLNQIRQDLEQAAARYPDPPQPPTTADAVTKNHRELASLYHAVGNTIERIAQDDLDGDRGQLYEDAARAHAHARELDPAEALYPLALARVLRKRASDGSAAANQQEHLAKALDLLAEAESKNEMIPEVFNERGAVYFALNDAAKARPEFAKAAQCSLSIDPPRIQYRYFCNLADANLREPASNAAFQAAVAAADRAIAVQPPNATDAHYYRGRALWQLGKLPTALKAFDNVLEREPKHLGALLARTLIVFDMWPPGSTEIRPRRARFDAETAVEVARETNATKKDQAKAHYVRSLARLREHAQSKSGESLLDALSDLLASVRLAPDYAQECRRVFSHAARFAWKDGNERKQFEDLQKAFEQLKPAAW